MATSENDPAREAILGAIRMSLGRGTASPVKPMPATARVAPRAPREPATELDLFGSEVTKLGGQVRRIADRAGFVAALAELVREEQVTRATLWSTPDLAEWQVQPELAALGVEIVAPQADKWQIATCELGVTGVDAALPESGTLLLRSTPERPRVVSLLPRVHLALLRPAALRPDLLQALAEVKGETFVFVTGPSRTADIELTLTLGVHGPKTLWVWVMEY